MVRIRPAQGIAAALVVGLALLAWSLLGTAPSAAPAAAAVPPRPAAAAAEVPRIGLARLSRQGKAPRGGRRDLFDSGPGPDARVSQGTASPRPLPPPTTLVEAAVPRPASAAPPPMNLRYIGSLESRKGLKVAFLLTDRKEVLTGQTGEVVANRFRIRRIGYESVEIQDLVSDSVLRLPLRGGN